MTNGFWSLKDECDGLSRRKFLKYCGLSLSAAFSPSCSSLLKRAPTSLESLELPPRFESWSPIDRTNIRVHLYSGDNPDRSHALLWNKAGLLNTIGAWPEPSERVPLVIVGGGMGGITSAYLLRKYRPVILERAERFGGNSRGESWQGVDYSLGAAYFMGQDSGSELAKFYRDSGIDQLWKVKSTEDPVAVRKKVFTDFWLGDSDPQRSSQFRKLHEYFENVRNGVKGLVFPEIPSKTDSMRELLSVLDQETFFEHLVRVQGGPLHPHVECALEHFCWSTLGASMNEISAAAGLNQFVAELGDVYITPGGNSALAEHLLSLAQREMPASCFRPSSVVIDVRKVSDGVLVSYENSRGELRTLHAQAVIMACSKFVVKRTLSGIENQRQRAIEQLKYHPYLVANVLIQGRVAPNFYDLFMLGDGKVNMGAVRESSVRHRVTDVVLGTYANPNQERTVLTLYRPLPYVEGRVDLLREDSHKQFIKEFEEQLNNEILPLLKISEKRVEEIRLSRWGHALPVAKKGLLSSGVVDELRKPFNGNVFFVSQDNWCLPCVEAVISEALAWAPEVEKVLANI